VPETWQLRHALGTSIALGVAVCQSGVACPPWQITFEQVWFATVKTAVPELALYAPGKEISPGGSLNAFFPVRALERL
jgi:hypothetical protein